jgi:ribosomal protein S5
MVMLEEFRRRKNLSRYFESMKKQHSIAKGETSGIIDMDDEAITKET